MSIRAIPLLFLVLILYNALVFVSGTPPEEIFYGKSLMDATTQKAIQSGAQLFAIPMPNGGTWHFMLGDLVMAIGLILLAIEVVKSTYTRGAGLADQALSTILFVIFLIEFLLVDRASTSLFFFLTMMSAFDVIVGSVVGIRTARRDIGFAPGGGGHD
jgi:hypothetical protein